VPVGNDPEITARFTDYMRNRADVAFEDAAVTMASEDYGYLISRIPGMMLWLGVGGAIRCTPECSRQTRRRLSQRSG
jgi:N-acetyldiaminopimelate deacetylase